MLEHLLDGVIGLIGVLKSESNSKSTSDAWRRLSWLSTTFPRSTFRVQYGLITNTNCINTIVRVQSLSNSETVDKSQIINGSRCTIDNMELMPTVSAELLYHAILQILQHLLPGLRDSVLEIPTPEGITRLNRHRKFHEILKASFSIHWQTLVGWPVSYCTKAKPRSFETRLPWRRFGFLHASLFQPYFCSFGQWHWTTMYTCRTQDCSFSI